MTNGSSSRPTANSTRKPTPEAGLSGQRSDGLINLAAVTTELVLLSQVAYRDRATERSPVLGCAVSSRYLLAICELAAAPHC